MGDVTKAAIMTRGITEDTVGVACIKNFFRLGGNWRFDCDLYLYAFQKSTCRYFGEKKKFSSTAQSQWWQAE